MPTNGVRYCSADCYHAATRVPLADRIMVKVDTISIGCWEWQGHKIGGYAMIWNKGRTERVSRLLWEILHKKLAKTDFVCHHCDNPACIRPSHFFLGDAKINAEDKVSKGRQAKGDSHGRRTRPERWARNGPLPKLSVENILEARSMRDSGMTWAAIAVAFNVSEANVIRRVRAI